MDVHRRMIGTNQATFCPESEIFLPRFAVFRQFNSMRLLNSGLSALSPEQVATKVAFIIQQLTGNANYPTTNPTLAALQTLLNALNAALLVPPGQMRDGAIATARPPLEAAVQDLADNLEQITPGNLEKLSTTGFDIRKTPSASNEPPPTPGNLRLKNLQASGDVQFVFEASDRAKSYQIQTTDNPNAGPWKDYDPVSSTRNVVAHGLPRAKDVWGRVRAIGPNNTRSAWSDPATVLVT
jgi:hypothetical protein